MRVVRVLAHLAREPHVVCASTQRWSANNCKAYLGDLLHAIIHTLGMKSKA